MQIIRVSCNSTGYWDYEFWNCTIFVAMTFEFFHRNKIQNCDRLTFSYCVDCHLSHFVLEFANRSSFTVMHCKRLLRCLHFRIQCMNKRDYMTNAYYMAFEYSKVDVLDYSMPHRVLSTVSLFACNFPMARNVCVTFQPCVQIERPLNELRLRWIGKYYHWKNVYFAYFYHFCSF